MKINVTIKHITLAVGILVAVLAAMMFIVHQSAPVESSHAVKLPSFVLPKAIPAVIQVMEILF